MNFVYGDTEMARVLICHAQYSPEGMIYQVQIRGQDYNHN